MHVRATLRVCLALAIAMPLLQPRHAHAAPVDTKEAERLFKLGREALDAGRYAEACATLERSFRIYPGTGTRLNLGTCYRELGDLEKSERMFRAAEEEATARGEDLRRDLARKGLASVESRKARVRFSADAGWPDKVALTLDGREFDIKNGDEMRVFQGTHRWVLRADGFRTLEGAVEIAGNGELSEQKVRWVPLLSSAPPPKEAPSHQATWGYAIGGAGALGALVTSGFFLQHAFANDWRRTEGDGPALSRMTYAGIGSMVLMGVGTALVLTAPKKNHTSVSLSPTTNGLLLHGSW